MFLSFPSQPACPPLLSPTGSPPHAPVHRLPPSLPRVAGHHDTTVAACPCRSPLLCSCRVAAPSHPLSPFLFSLLCQRAIERSPRLPSPSCLLSDSEHPTASPYSPLPRLAILVHRRPPAIVGLHRITAALPCSGGSHLHARPLLSLNFVSWLTSSSSFSRCCRSCPRSSTTVVGAHIRQEAPTPASSTASPSPCAIGEHPSYPPCPVAHSYYHGSRREDVAPIWSSAGRYTSRRRGCTGRGAALATPTSCV
jgi:hypothetical protein